MARLVLHHLDKRFGAHAAVCDLSLEVRDGELMCLLGPSGCGKTTTLRMIGGFATPDSGDIEIDGHSIVTLPPERRPTAMVFQRYNLWPHMTVAQNIAFGLRLRRLSRPRIEAKVQDALALVGLPGAGRKYPHELSGGEQQRVAVARALVLEPQILLLDEPFSNLDARLRVHMREEVKQLQRAVGITTVFVTHDQEEALTIADRIAVMKDGVLQQVDTPDMLYARPRTLFVADFIGTMNLLPARVGSDGTVTAGPWQFALPAQSWLAQSQGPAGAANAAPRPTDDARSIDATGGGPRVDAGDGAGGVEATLAVRPEDLVVGADGAPAQVRRIVNLGHYLHVLLECAGAGTLRMFADKSAPLAEGQEIRVRAARALVFSGPEVIEVGGPMRPPVAAPADST
jgi:putative spermidine/putrescine transport system ATP-binding protein